MDKVTTATHLPSSS